MATRALTVRKDGARGARFFIFFLSMFSLYWDRVCSHGDNLDGMEDYDSDDFVVPDEELENIRLLLKGR